MERKRQGGIPGKGAGQQQAETGDLQSEGRDLIWDNQTKIWGSCSRVASVDLLSPGCATSCLTSLHWSEKVCLLQLKELHSNS